MRSALVVHEWVAGRDSWSCIEAAIHSLGAQVPQPQGWTRGPGFLVLRVRPGRVLILAEDAQAASPRAQAISACGDFIIIDQSGGHAALIARSRESGAAWSSLCRVNAWDRPGRAISTLIAQVPVILAALPEGILLLGPSSYAQHLDEALDRAGIRCGPATVFGNT